MVFMKPLSALCSTLNVPSLRSTLYALRYIKNTLLSQPNTLLYALRFTLYAISKELWNLIIGKSEIPENFLFPIFYFLYEITL